MKIDNKRNRFILLFVFFVLAISVIFFNENRRHKFIDEHILKDRLNKHVPTLLSEEIYAQKEIENSADANKNLTIDEFKKTILEYNYKETPRLYLTSFPKNWADNVDNTKKKIFFFKIVLPMVLKVNEEINQQRELLLTLIKKDTLANKEESIVIGMLKRYKILNEGDISFNKKDIEQAKIRIDKIIPSIALAQAAVESGYGTSRFAYLGNSLFGEWSWTGGIKPRSRQSGDIAYLEDYSVQSFSTLLDSVRSYAFNINSGWGYNELRRERQKFDSAQISGYELAKFTKFYSQQREAYSDLIQQIIKENSLEKFDEAKFDSNKKVDIYYTCTNTN